MLFRLIKGFASLGQTPAVAATQGGAYVCLMGGLGNQLFQYAFARFLTSQGVAVNGLVTNLFDNEKYARQLLVHAFSRIPAVRLSRDEVAALQLLTDENGLAIRDLLLQRAQTGAVCRGYWQDATYANAVVGELTGDLQTFGQREHSVESAGECVVHVRRHDYGHNGVLPFAYYQAALEHCGAPSFKVVTDEPNYCEYMFARLPGYAGVVRGNTADPWSDFFLMSRARLQIIANSSFSWWTAWLGRATGATATVIAPAEWSLIENSDRCPADWHRIDMRLVRP